MEGRPPSPAATFIPRILLAPWERANVKSLGSWRIQCKRKSSLDLPQPKLGELFPSGSHILGDNTQSVTRGSSSWVRNIRLPQAKRAWPQALGTTSGRNPGPLWPCRRPLRTHSTCLTQHDQQHGHLANPEWDSPMNTTFQWCWLAQNDQFHLCAAEYNTNYSNRTPIITGRCPHGRLEATSHGQHNLPAMSQKLCGRTQ